MTSSIKATCGQKLDCSVPFAPGRLDDTCALVTGGATGIGLGLVQALAGLGAQVIIADISVTGAQVAAELCQKGFRVLHHHTDVTDYQSQLDAFKAARALSVTGSVDIVIPCAGVSEKSFRETLKAAGADGQDCEDPPPPTTAVFDVNLRGVYYTTYLAYHFFRVDSQCNTPNRIIDKQIIFISSLAGYRPLQLNPGYNGAKYGVRGIWHALRDQSGAILNNAQQSPCRIRTNLVAPSFVRTRLTEHIIGNLEQRNILVAEVGDVVDAVLRCVCDPEVSGRAIAVACGEPPGSGNKNFDLGDDALGGFAGSAFADPIQHGVYGSGFNMSDC